jgi:hypothetical protein
MEKKFYVSPGVGRGHGLVELLVQIPGAGEVHKKNNKHGIMIFYYDLAVIPIIIVELLIVICH